MVITRHLVVETEYLRSGTDETGGVAKRGPPFGENRLDAVVKEASREVEAPHPFHGFISLGGSPGRVKRAGEAATNTVRGTPWRFVLPTISATMTIQGDFQ